MNPVFGLFVVVVIEMALGIAVWARNPRRPLNRWFAAFAVNIAIWGAGVGLRRIVSDPAVALIVLRVTFAAGTLIPVTFLQFGRVFPRPSARWTRFDQAVTVAGLF